MSKSLFTLLINMTLSVLFLDRFNTSIISHCQNVTKSIEVKSQINMGHFYSLEVFHKYSFTVVLQKYCNAKYMF